MKKKNLIIQRLFTFIVAFVTLFITSCSKEEVNKISNSPESLNILSFKNVKEYSEAQKIVNSLNTKELKTYEESRGYKSFGRLCDEFYNNINPEEFKSIEEIKLFVAKNSEYLQLLEDENGEFTLETVLLNNSNRYFLNKDKMFKIDETVYKVFEKGVAMASITNIELLKNVNDPNIFLTQVDKSIHFMPANDKSNSLAVTKDAAYNCGTTASRSITNGRDRTHIDMSIDYLDSYDINGLPQTVFQNRLLIRPYKKTLLVWYWCSRTISCDIKVAIDVLLSSNVYERSYYYYDEPGISDSKIEKNIDGGIVSWGYWARYTDMHYAGYDAWGDTPSTDPPALIQCNTDLF